ncbi:unnamed protein product [Lepeophtheirus salmonis]|uniref:(salmon louse) hypothetical protein n=1 Tax=Lepeophtheirus salmonis TaxID=72036 RepID=A0A0K2T8H4_LEPSM|nr:unnamed protein product [Lepeophtheirus salmonis]CAF2938370.1 unnamed protein product [Lepeophtheirus salmonis]
MVIKCILYYLVATILVIQIAPSFGDKGECYCTCSDNSKCIRISKFLRVLPICGCLHGTCPPERVYRGSQSCGSSHYIPLFLRPFFVPTSPTSSISQFMKKIRFELFSGDVNDR